MFRKDFLEMCASRSSKERRVRDERVQFAAYFVSEIKIFVISTN
jgi:hypothetical protein